MLRHHTVVYRLKPPQGRSAAAALGFAAHLAKDQRAIRVYKASRTSAGAKSEAFAVRASDENEAREILEALLEDPCVERAYGAPPRALAMRKVVGSSSHLDLSWRQQVRLPAAQGLSQWSASKSVAVAIVDSGVDTTHPALAHVKMNDYLLSPSTQLDPTGHGTHVTGLIAARAQGGWTSEGVAASIADVTAHRGLTNVYDPVAYYRALRGALTSARVVNLSISGDTEDDEESDEIALAIANGVVVVAAAGNEGEFNEELVPYPASLPGVIAVAAVDSADKVAGFSSQGMHVYVAAPGVDVGSTVPTYPVSSIVSVAIPSGANLSGTSMASPIVAGIVARILSHRPDLSPSDVRDALRGDRCGCSALEVGVGRIDAEATMRHL